MKKKLRVSLLWRIALLFLVALFLATGFNYVIGQRELYEDAANQGQYAAKAASVAVKIALGSRKTVEILGTDQQKREDIHSAFRFICNKTGIKYIYLFTVDENDYREYYVCAALDDEADKKMNREYGFGIKHPNRELYEAERLVLSGEKEEAFEFIDNSYGDVCMYIFPIFDEDQNIEALIGVDYSMEEIKFLLKDNLTFFLTAEAFVILIATILAIIFIRFLVIRPINELSDRMRNFLIDRENDKAFKKRKVFFYDEITEIEDSFNEMAEDISNYISDIEKLNNEKIVVKAQMDVARRIQCGIVPLELEMSDAGYEIFGLVRPTKEVGGDFYDIFNIDNDWVCMSIGDISGKGITAALFMVMVKTFIRENLKHGYSIADTMSFVNKEILESNPENMFATVFCAMLNQNTGELRFANAGHNRPVLLTEKCRFLDTNTGTIIGVFDDAEIAEEHIYLKDGEGIFLYTDGITEAVNSQKVQYGEEKLVEYIENKYKKNENEQSVNARELATSLVESVDSHARGTEQFDDITCVALIYKENQDQELEKNMVAFESVKKAIISSLGEGKNANKAILACEEMFTNILNYSGADSVRFSCSKEKDCFKVSFSDDGIPFDPVTANLPQKEFEELDTGGMGINLARAYSKEMYYSRVDGRNKLTLQFET